MFIFYSCVINLSYIQISTHSNPTPTHHLKEIERKFPKEREKGKKFQSKREKRGNFILIWGKRLKKIREAENYSEIIFVKVKSYLWLITILIHNQLNRG